MIKKVIASILVLLSVAVLLHPVLALLGDVNGDGHVDGKDLTVVAYAFGSYPGQPNWIPNADLNHDLTVDGKDLVIVARNFGT
jgi:hypothetical protein